MDNLEEILAESLKSFSDSLSDEYFGRDYVRRFIKERENISEQEIARYKLQLDIKDDKTNFGMNFKDRIYNARYNFCLTHNNELIASLGLDFTNDGIYISHMQGTKGKDVRLKCFKWRKALLTYAIDWARENKIREVMLISYENSCKLPNRKHLVGAQGKLLNDIQTEKFNYEDLIFELDEESRNYVLNLNYPAVTEKTLLDRALDFLGVPIVKKLLR